MTSYLGDLPLDSIIFAVYSATAGWYCWARRDHVAALAASLRRACADLLACPPWRPLARAPESPDDARVRKLFEAEVVQCGKWWIEGMAVMLTLLVGTFLALLGSQDEPSVHGHMQKWLGALSACYVLVVAVCFGDVQLTPRRIAAVYVVINAIMILRMLSSDVMPYFYTELGLRTIYRGVLTLLVMDARVVSAVTACWLPASLFHQSMHTIPDAQCQLMAVNPYHFAVCEVSTSLLLVIFSVVTEGMVKVRVRLNFGMLHAKNVQGAMRGVLDVLCDAELHLDAGLKIQDPSRKVSHLLAPDQGAAGEAAIERRSFLDFITECDQSRFQGFLSVAAGTAKLIQVRLRDSTGWSFPVELFHTTLPDVESCQQPGHFIGIRECCPTRKETSPAAEPQGPTLRPGRPDAACPPASPPIDGLGGEALVAERREPHVGAAASEAASSVEMLHQGSFPQLSSVEIRFDCDALGPVKELRCCFDADAAGSSQEEPLLLKSFIHECMCEELQCWVQARALAMHYGSGLNASFGPVRLRLPLALRRTSGEMLFEAAEVALKWAVDSGDSEEGESATDAPGADDVILILQSFTQLSVQPRRHDTQGSARSVKAYSLRSHGSGERLQPICEGVDASSQVLNLGAEAGL